MSPKEETFCAYKRKSAAKIVVFTACIRKRHQREVPLDECGIGNLRLPLLVLLLRNVLVGDEEQDARDKIQEDERADTIGDRIRTFALVDIPTHDGHRNHPGEGEDEPAITNAREDIQNERNQTQRAILAGHRIDLLRIEDLVLHV